MSGRGGGWEGGGVSFIYFIVDNKMFLLSMDEIEGSVPV